MVIIFRKTHINVLQSVPIVINKTVVHYYFSLGEPLMAQKLQQLAAKFVW